MTSCLLSSVSPDDEIFQTRSTLTRQNFFLSFKPIALRMAKTLWLHRLHGVLVIMSAIGLHRLYGVLAILSAIELCRLEFWTF